MKRIGFLLFLSSLLYVGFAQNPYSLTAPPQTIDFTGFNGSGFVAVPGAGELDSDEWEIIGCSDGYTVGGGNTTGDHARGVTAGGVTGGGIYGLNSGGNQAIWVQPTGADMTPGEIVLFVENNTGAAIPDLAIEYDILSLNNGDRACSLDFAYDLGTGRVAVPTLDYTTTQLAVASPAVVITSRSTSLIGINLAVGATIELVWQVGDAGGSGSRDELGIDDIVIGGVVTPTVSVGFAVNSSSSPEGNAGSSAQTIDVTMPIAPTGANVVVDVTLDGTGSATPGTDFVFPASVQLTFTTGSSYPQTQSVLVIVNGDATVEPNESVDLSLSVSSGTANVGQNTHRFFINNDDAPSGDGIIVNEASQGENTGSGRYEYIELLVIGTPGETVDLRGWIIDDNSGVFTGGAGSQLGIAPGHVKFSDHCTWEKVPVGALIVVYSNDLGSTPPTATMNTAISTAFPGGDDPTDANLDFTYVVGIDQLVVGGCASAGPSLYFSSDCANPSSGAYDQYLPAVFSNPDWATITMRNTGDAVQTRAPDASYFHGFSYGYTTGGSCGTCDFSSANHPEFGTQGANSLVFDTLTYGPDQRVYSFINTISNDARDRRNWNTAAVADNTSQTPGAPNSIANDTYIQSLRQAFPVVTSDHTYTCDLRGNETRAYIGTNDSLILWIRNNTAFDHGPLTAQSVFNPTGPFRNLNIAGLPYFAAKQFRADPTNASGTDDYTIRLYLTNADLNELATYINGLAGTSYTGASLIPQLRMYKVPGLTDLPSNTNGAGVTDQAPTTGTFNGTTSFENTWTGGFSAFGLGIPENVLDGEAILLSAESVQTGVSLSWTALAETPLSQTLWRISGHTKLPIQRLEGDVIATRDMQPLAGANMYQISAALADGRTIWSNTVEVVQAQALMAGNPYPQPSTGEINFPTALAPGAIVALAIYDLAGKEVSSQQLETNATGLVTVELDMPSGVFVYRLQANGKMIVGKIVLR
ncbi:MAG: T9SS type A sorting domain-containing protein [Bacteroidia bacterium]